jgi:hypothetical protein
LLKNVELGAMNLPTVGLEAATASRHRHGGWRPGDPIGQRQFSQLFGDTALELELGGRLGPLTQAMNRHDVGRGRGGIDSALGRITARVRLVAVASDRLFPPHRHQELAAGLRSGVTTSTFESQLGHDAYVLESGKLSEIVRQSLG